MASDSMRPVHLYGAIAMAFVPIAMRVALLLLVAATTPATGAQDNRPPPQEHVVGDRAYPFDTVDPREKEKQPIELPESVVSKLELLTPEQIEFLKSGDARAFTGPAEEAVDALEKRTPEEVKAWVEAMQQVVEGSRYTEGLDLPNIPFNTESTDFNAWRLVRPRSMDPKREAGPVALGRYSGGGGPPTFGGFPLALSKEDLVAGEVDVAILGAPLNMGGGWRLR